MASPPATSPISDHSCYDQKQQQTNTPALPSPELTDRSDTGSAPGNDCEIIDFACEKNREFIDSASETGRSATDSTPKNDRTIIISKKDRKLVKKAFQAIKASFEGESARGYLTFHFESPSSFQSLQERLRNSSNGLSQFVDNKLRLDWNINTCDLLLRLMPTTIHDLFEASVDGAITAKLLAIAKNDSRLKPFVSQIFPGHHSDIQHTDEKGAKFNRSPDGQFCYKKSPFPLLIFEVAYAQSEKEVLKKAIEYFHNLSDCTLITFDLTYPRSHQNHKRAATDGVVSFYMTSELEARDGDMCNMVDVEQENAVFQSAGQPMEGKIEIPFSRFVPQEQRHNVPEDAPNVCFDFSEFSKFLCDARAHYCEVQLAAAAQGPPKAVVFKRKDREEERIEPGLAPSKKKRRN
ncbi:hypothetical protein F4803DRAFT_388252 [Xylaria telfairii]|nr:hypothetical protein F4803DRAFT_388252 [Xylaria telfairii]